MDDKFTKLEQASWGGFLGIHGLLDKMIEADLQEHSRLSHVEFEILLRLSWEVNQRLRIQDLAARSVLSSSGVSRAVERLERAGLVRREEAPEDRRGAYAILTEAGGDRLRTAMSKHVAFVRAHFLNLFDEKELKQMADFWSRVEAAVQKK